MLIQEIEDLFVASAHKTTANKTKMTDNDWVGRGHGHAEGYTG